MSNYRHHIFSILGFMLLCLILGLIFFKVKEKIDLAYEAPFSNPASSFNENLLIGEWTTDYSESRSEKLVIQADGNFIQVYTDNEKNFESPLKNWWIEKLGDGRIYLHLEGAKYFLQGRSAADNGHVPCLESDTECKELAGRIPTEAYDWVGNNWVDVTGKLVLNIRMDSSGEIILLHLWKNSDRGFPIIGGEAEIFRKSNSP